MDLKLKLRILRHFKGLDQWQMAAKLNISIADYSKMETGLIKADGVILEKIMAVFELDQEQFNLWPDEKTKDLVAAYLY